MHEPRRYLRLAILASCLALTAIATFVAAPLHPTSFNAQPLLYAFLFTAATLTLSAVLFLILGATRVALLHVINVVYRVLFSTMPGAGKLHLKQDGLLWCAPDGRVSYLAF